MLYHGVAVGVCVGTVLYLCNCRSCSVTERVTGGRNSRVRGDVVGGARGWIVQERGVGITEGSGRSGWLGIRIVCKCSGGGLQTVMDTVVGGWLIGWIVCERYVGCGTCGLQLLATTVSVSSLSSSSFVRIWKGLLCPVRCWCTMGNCRMVFGAMMVFDVVATLGGAATATLRGVAGTTLGDVGSVGGALGWPDKMVVS
jgi:hypothetical protein